MEHNRIAMHPIAAEFKIRSSATLDICAGEDGLTEKQTLTYNDLKAKATRTPKQDETLKQLQHKLDNPHLPQGAKTYCKQWLKERLFGRRNEVKSKYLDKGNLSEEDGFTLMCLELNLGMVYKNHELFEDEYSIGTPDLKLNKVYDNKCSWSLDTFPLFETEIPDEKYEWQINSYCAQTGIGEGVLAYTLIDCPKELIEREIKWETDHNKIYKKVANLVFTKEYFEQLRIEYFYDADLDCFVEIPEDKRVKTFDITLDAAKIAFRNKRVIMCREYINELLNEYFKN